ncbi:MAG: hypothetical protein L6R28_09130 [Planctomycetes bacterium]|nr:hypothetical protein [Planctomycetota bacterium]
MKKLATMIPCALGALAVLAWTLPGPTLATSADARHGGMKGAFGSHGIRNRLDFILNTAQDGRDRLYLLLDLDDEAFDSAQPEFLKERLVTLTLSLEAHEEASAAADGGPRHADSWTWSDVTDGNARIKTREVKLRLVFGGNGFALDLERGHFEALKEMLEGAGPRVRLHLHLTHNHPPHDAAAAGAAPRHAHTLWEGDFDVDLKRGKKSITGRGTPAEVVTEEEAHHEPEAF